MTADELAAIQEMHPTALARWYDKMLSLDKGQLIETLLVMMSAGELYEYIGQIEADIAKERANGDGPREATE